MISTDDLTRVTGSTVVGSDGESIGTAREVYLDDATGEPEWVTVGTGFLGTSESFVPLVQAQLSGDRLQVPYDKRQVKDAPHLGSAGHLTPEEEDQLLRYYGVTGAALPGTPPVDPAPTAGADVSGPTDEAMTRSEERLRVGTERRVTGRARLRKFVTTEVVTVEVPVRREEVRLVEEPVGGGGAGDVDAGEPYDGPPVDVAEGEHVVVLHEERPVVTVETVPVERVRLATQTVTETRAVSGEVRTEHIEVDGDVAGSRTDEGLLDGADQDGTPGRGTGV